MSRAAHRSRLAPSRRWAAIAVTVVVIVIGAALGVSGRASEARDRAGLVRAVGEVRDSDAVHLDFTIRAEGGSGSSGAGRRVRGQVTFADDALEVRVGELHVRSADGACTWLAGRPVLIDQVLCHHLTDGDSGTSDDQSIAERARAAAREAGAVLAGDSVDVDAAPGGWDIEAHGGGVAKVGRLLGVPTGPVEDLHLRVARRGGGLHVTGRAASALTGAVHVDAAVHGRELTAAP